MACVQGAGGPGLIFLAYGLHKFKGMVWNMTSSQDDVIRGLGEKASYQEDKAVCSDAAATRQKRSEPCLSKYIGGARHKRKVII